MNWRDNRFLRNVATLQVGGGLTAVMNFISSVGLAHLLGARDQGSWVVALQLYALSFFLFNMGVVQVAVTQVASASARGNADKVRDWLAFLVKVYLLIGVTLVVLGRLAFPPLVELWRSYSPNVDARLWTWAWMLTFLPLIEMPRALVAASFQGTRRMVALAQLENSLELVRVFLVLAGAVVMRSPLGAALGQLLAAVVGGFISIAIYQREARREGAYQLPRLGSIARRVPGVALGAGVGLGLRFGVIRQIDGLSIKILPPLIIQTFARSEWVAYFRIAQGVMSLPLQLGQGFSRTAMPALSELRGLKDHTRFRSLYWRATLGGGALVSVAILCALPLVRPFVQLLPDDYHGPVWTLALILAAGYLPLAFMIAVDSFYLLTGTLRVGMTISAVGFVISMAAMTWLAWRFPETGVAWGFVVIGAFGFMNVLYSWAWFRRQGDTLRIVES